VWRHPILTVLLLTYIVWGAANWYANRPVRQAADLAPEDLALGWGPMSDNQVLRTLEISQANRFYYWRATAATSITRQSIITHSANTHVIPQNSAIAAAFKRLRPGEVVTLRGELVDAVRKDGRSLKTSLVREDTGAGACEVMPVTDVSL
jgi:hypothetical protein